MAKRSKHFGLNISMHVRARMKRTGKGANGVYWLWTQKEDDLIREHYPDFSKIRLLLRRRKIDGIKRRANYLGMVRPQNLWTINEVTKLRHRWKEASRDELIAEFPRHTWFSIRTKGSKLHVRRRPWKPKPTGKPILDEIRNRAASLRISLFDLDRICSAGSYFAQSSQGHIPIRNALLRAIAALGGKVEIVWR